MGPPPAPAPGGAAASWLVLPRSAQRLACSNSDGSVNITCGASDVYTLTVAGDGVGLAAGTELVVVCSSNIASNGAAGSVITFDIVSNSDNTALEDQVGFTLTATANGTSLAWGGATSADLMPGQARARI